MVLISLPPGTGGKGKRRRSRQPANAVSPSYPGRRPALLKVNQFVSKLMNLLVISFDGGMLPKKKGYGSWQIEEPRTNTKHQVHRIEYPAPCTSNVSEWLSLLGALRFLCALTKPTERTLFSLRVCGDSQLVIKQLTGEYRCMKPHLQPFLAEAKQILNSFGKWEASWHRRSRSVALFGH